MKPTAPPFCVIFSLQRFVAARKKYKEERDRHRQQSQLATFQSKNPDFYAVFNKSLESIRITYRMSNTFTYHWHSGTWAGSKKFWDDLPQDLLDWIDLVAFSSAQP